MHYFNPNVSQTGLAKVTISSRGTYVISVGFVDCFSCLQGGSGTAKVKKIQIEMRL